MVWTIIFPMNTASFGHPSVIHLKYSLCNEGDHGNDDDDDNGDAMRRCW